MAATRPRCRHRLSWNPTWRCQKRAMLGRCVEHHLERVNLHWRTPWSSFSLDLDNINRPQLQVDEDHRPREWIAVSWGNGHGDPVWSLQLNRRDRAV